MLSYKKTLQGSTNRSRSATGYCVTTILVLLHDKERKILASRPVHTKAKLFFVQKNLFPGDDH